MVGNRAGGCRHGRDLPGHHGLRRGRARQLRGEEPGVLLDLLAATMPDGGAALYCAMDRPAPAIHRGEVALRISAQPREDLIAPAAHLLQSFKSLSDIESTASALISMSRTKHCRASR